MYCVGTQCADAEIKSVTFEMKQSGQLLHMIPGFVVCFFSQNCYVSTYTLLKLVYVLGKLMYHFEVKKPQTSECFCLKNNIKILHKHTRTLLHFSVILVC